MSACTQQPRDQGYARAILDRPLPTGETGTGQECDFLFRETARQRAMAQALPKSELLAQTAQAIQKATETNIAALKQRQKQAGCAPSLDDATLPPAAPQ